MQILVCPSTPIWLTALIGGFVGAGGWFVLWLCGWEIKLVRKGAKEEEEKPWFERKDPS